MADDNLSGSGIYAIWNVNTGRPYVGSAVCIRVRWMEHRKFLRAQRHHSPKLQHSWAKHTEAAFKFEVLEFVADPSDLVGREQHWMDALDAVQGGYNCAPRAGSQLGYKHSEESRRRMSEAGKRRAAKGILNGKGRIVSDEARAKMSAAARARKSPPPSDETKAKISASLTGSPNHRGQRGRKFSDEHRAKIGAAHKAMWAKRRGENAP